MNRGRHRGGGGRRAGGRGGRPPRRFGGPDVRGGRVGHVGPRASIGRGGDDGIAVRPVRGLTVVACRGGRRSRAGIFFIVQMPRENPQAAGAGGEELVQVRLVAGEGRGEQDQDLCGFAVTADAPALLRQIDEGEAPVPEDDQTHAVEIHPGGQRGGGDDHGGLSGVEPG